MNSTPIAIDVAAYWNDAKIPVMNKIALLKFGETLELDPTKSMSEKLRLIKEWIVFNQSMANTPNA